MEIGSAGQGTFLSIATTVSGVFLVMAMGALARYLKWFTSEVDRSMAGFTTNVLLPSFFFHRILTDPKLSSSLGAWTPALFGLGLTVMGFAIAALVVYLVGRWFGLHRESELEPSSCARGWPTTGTFRSHWQKRSILAASLRCLFTMWESIRRSGALGCLSFQDLVSRNPGVASFLARH